MFNIQALMSRLHARNPNLEVWEVTMLTDTAQRLSKDDWSFDDAVAYLALTEHVSPEIPENEALAKMRAIRVKYN